MKVNDQGRKPRPRKEKRAPSPVLLEEPDISLEEPPIKVRRTTSASGSSFLQELECSPSTCDTSGSVSEIEEIQFVDINEGTIENDNTNSEIKKDKLKGKKKETDKEKETNKRKEIESEKDNVKRREINTEKENDNDKETEKSKDNGKKKETGKEKGTDKRQGLTNVLPGRPGQVQNHVGQVQFPCWLPSRTSAKFLLLSYFKY